MGNSSGPSMSANSGNYNYYSDYSFISFSGFINENFFNIYPEKNLVQNLDISHGITSNPFTFKKDAFLGLFLKSKYDGIGKREPIDLSIALDISGSMFCTEEHEVKSRLDLAKETLIKLVSIMDNDDRLSLITFNQKAKTIFGLSNKGEIEKSIKQYLEGIKAGGGTNLIDAAIASLDNLNMNENNNKKKRIVFITDAYYDDTSEELFNLIKYNAEDLKVPCTIMAISSESNITLADKLCHFNGCNYFTITKSSDLENYLVQNFSYYFFPIAYQTKLKIKSDNAKIIKCIGGEKEFLDELSKEKNNLNENIIEYDLGTSFSTKMIKLEKNGTEKFYSKGGLILLKISPDDLNKDEDIKFEFTLEYVQDDNNSKSSQNYSYIIKKEEKNNEFFKNDNIKKGIAIYYFVNALNYLVNSEKEKKNDPNKKNKEKDMKMLETRQVIGEYLKSNFGAEPDNEENERLFHNYMNLIEKRYEGFKKFIIKFYNLDAAPAVL
jgi:uncharacterized protein YegL